MSEKKRQQKMGPFIREDKKAKSFMPKLHFKLGIKSVGGQPVKRKRRK